MPTRWRSNITSLQPGESGNPDGRPKVLQQVRDLARQHTVAAIEKLAVLMEKGGSEQVQLMAANALLDRGWGKPTQPTAGDDDAPPVRIDARVELLRVLNQLAADRDQGLDCPGDPDLGGGPGGAVGAGGPFVPYARAEGDLRRERAGGNGAGDAKGLAMALSKEPKTPTG
jgi:hypothetical protein